MNLTELLNELLVDYSDVKISKITGIERTRINRIRNGKFKIEIEELQNIISSFSVDKEKAKKLYEAYEIETIGLDKYKSRKLVKSFLCDMDYDIKNEKVQKALSNAKISINFDIPEKSLAIDGKFYVEQSAVMIITQALKTKDKIRIITPHDNVNLMSLIYFIMTQNPDIQIDHIFSLATTEELPEPYTYYMNMARVIYPIFMLNSNYNAYYALVGYATNAILPFGIITNDFAMMLSYDGSSGIITKQKDIIELYKKLFDEKLEQSSSFIIKINTAEEFLEHYCSLIQNTNPADERVFYSIDYEPCVISYLTEREVTKAEEIIQNKPQLAKTIQTFMKVYSPNFFAVHNQISFFTKDGLRSFVETGEIAEIPSEFGVKYDKGRRKEILIDIYNKIQHNKGNRRYYMINENEFKLPLGIRFLGTGSKNDHLFILSNQKEGFRSILGISQPQVLKVVFDFIESLPDTNMVYSKQELLDYLKEVISQL